MKLRFSLLLAVVWTISVNSTVAAIGRDSLFVMDMVHHNPNDTPFESAFCKPAKLASMGMDAMVINEFKFPHCAVTFDSIDSNIFPHGSDERLWARSLAKEINDRIKECHKNGLQALYFTDIIVLPKTLVELYRDEICDSQGKISFSRPKTWEIHRVMIEELFQLFPDMDGLVIRTGETYTHNIPYHCGNGPVDYKNDYEGSIAIHAGLLNMLREEVCVKRGKKVVYRTWDFGYFHTRPDYYMSVTSQVEPHPLLYMSVKHTQGDYLRTFPFNRTIALGCHKQLIEVQCQREYEGKGAYPNYIADAVINGFEETLGSPSPRCLNDVKDHPLFAGIWTWSRGGGWFGPYLKNELWCDLNAYVLSQWGHNPDRSEADIFEEYAALIGITPATYPDFRRLCMLTPDAIIRGRGSLVHDFSILWTRDHYLGGEKQLLRAFEDIVKKDIIQESLDEMKQSTLIWEEIDSLAQRVKCSDSVTESYIRTSSRYGLLLYRIMYHGFAIMLKGYIGDKTGHYDVDFIREAILNYDRTWEDYRRLKADNTDCASLYYDRYVTFGAGGIRNNIEFADGMGAGVDRYRHL